MSKETYNKIQTLGTIAATAVLLITTTAFVWALVI